ncbi:MAG: hypothetical protein VXY94_03765 [Planctomycetota bacterium]|nr:hypothetical protein [Planctomycetota bacterium]MEC8734416.1 hypothetical protein [Planctomycetota bacterium]MEC9156692.1 hypothetical protein [Planctomycetota bacterium]MED5507966.1 hypothetical protein [Planctomycetota bacterium]
MNLIWPRFHDPDYRPGHLAMLKIHWQANLAMLRSSRDVGLFMLISLLPVGMLLLILAMFPVGFDPTVPATGSILGLLIVGLLVFYLVQHVAFMIAMELTYTHHVRRAIQRGGTPICLRCGHLLHEVNDLCSECGAFPGGRPMEVADKKTFSKASSPPGP